MSYGWSVVLTWIGILGWTIGNILVFLSAIMPGPHRRWPFAVAALVFLVVDLSFIAYGIDSSCGSDGSRCK